GANVLLGLRSFRALRTSIKLPRRDHDLLLGIDKIVDRSVVAGTGHRLALRQRKLLLERLDLEEKDIAAGFVGSLAARDVARARVVGHEIAWPYVKIFEIQSPPTGNRCRAPRDIERHDLFIAAPHRVHKIKVIDPVVIVRLCLDVDLLERRHSTIARWFDDMDLWRTIRKGADEVFDIAGTRQTFAIGQRQAIRTVLNHS